MTTTQGQSIHNFIKGDVVTRIKPAEFVGGFGPIQDRSYLGEPLLFVGIANGCAYFKRGPNDLFVIIRPDKKDELLGLQLDIWTDGWERYVDPNTLLTQSVTTENLFDSLSARIQQAIAKEDFELAEELKRQIDQLNKQQP